MRKVGGGRRRGVHVAAYEIGIGGRERVVHNTRAS